MLAESGCSTGEIPDVPTATDLVKVSGLRFSSSDLLRMERIILDKLEWNLSVNASTPLYFLQVFHALCVSKGFLDHCPVSQHLQHITASLEDLLCYHKFMFFKPSTLSLALLSCELVYVSSNWLLAMHYLQQEAKIPDAELWQCSKLLNEHFNSISNNHLSRFKTLSITDREDQPFTVIEN